MQSSLAVKGLKQIYAAVLNCWSSQFTFQAVQYRHQHGQPLANVPMAVVIQRMVDADVSGVMFTCDLLTGDRRQVVLTANFGLCEVSR